MGAYQGQTEDETEGSGENVAYTAASARSAALKPGRYYIYATTDCWWIRGTTTAAATVDSAAGTGKTSHFLPAGTFWFVNVKTEHIGAKDQIAAIRSASDGTLYIRRAAK